VDSLFQKMALHFTDEIPVYYLQEKFKLLDVQVYIRLGDLIEHLDDFRAHLDLLGCQMLRAGPFPSHCREVPEIGFRIFR
jgi:hypothetical protein